MIGIWDQGGGAFPAPKLRVVEDQGLRTRSYGSEIIAKDIAIALAESRAAKVSPW